MMMTSLDQRFEHLTMGAVQSPEASTSDQHLPPLYDRYVPGLDQRAPLNRIYRRQRAGLRRHDTSVGGDAVGVIRARHRFDRRWRQSLWRVW
jgi:hypothetical protein